MADAHATVLVVEDDPYDRELLRRVVQRAEIPNPLQMVGDGEQAIRYLAGDPPYDDRDRFPLPGLVLLDVKLPRIDGFGVLRWLRTHPVLGSMPAVVVSSSAEPSDQQRASELRADAYVVKPLKSDLLVELLERF